jgi:YidC/Oxa1 family membrane protein insertase
MNIKDLIISLLLALGITLLVQYLFFGRESKKAPAERVRIIPKTDTYRPVDIEIDFWDKEFNIDPVNTKISTSFAEYVFSNEGAALIRADFKHATSGNNVLLPGIRSNGREDRSCILAFNKKTPYYFDLVSNQDLADTTRLEYKASFDGGHLTKVFTIYKEKPQIDLHILFDPNKSLSDPYRLRLIYDIPSILHASNKDEARLLQMHDDPLFGIVDSYGKVVKKPVMSLFDRYWENPVSFGGLDKYLVISTINNDSNFAQRGYYNLYSDNLLRAYLESPEIQDKTEWHISFYVGPKKASAFDQVDPNLDQLLDFGFLAPLSKLLLRIMNFFYGYVGNFGWAIILITILIKIVTLPFSLKAEKNGKKVAEMNRKMEYIQQKYKNDAAALARARSEIMQKYGVSSVSGCLVPLLVQLPVFIALRNILSTSLELYMSPFLWINNLVAPDPLYIFPLLVGACLFVQTSANNPDPRKKLNSLAMGIFLGAVFSSFSAGITLHFFVSSLLNILQTKLYNKYGQS